MKELAARRPTRAGRIWDYLRVTFPPLPLFAGALLSFAAVYFLYEAVALHARLAYTVRAVEAVYTGFSVSLLLRIYDELKDVETDRRLGAAGDPKYVNRPIVKGLVDPEDLRALSRVLQISALAVNLFLGPVIFAAFAVLFVVTWMSSRWFFWPPMRDRLMIAFATHNPLTLLLQIYGVVVYVEDFGSATLPIAPVVATIVAQQGLASAWEVSRKIRAPQDETSYTTYSKVLGWRAAPVLPAIAIAVSTGCVAWVSSLAGLNWVYLGAVVLAGILVLGALLRFRLTPNAKTSQLRPYVEAFAVVVNLGGLVALVVRWGVTLAPIK